MARKILVREYPVNPTDVQFTESDEQDDQTDQSQGRSVKKKRTRKTGSSIADELTAVFMVQTINGMWAELTVNAAFEPGRVLLKKSGGWSANHWGDIDRQRLDAAITQGLAMLTQQRFMDLKASQQNADNELKNRKPPFTLDELRDAASLVQRQNREAGRELDADATKRIKALLHIADSRVYRRGLDELGVTYKDVRLYIKGRPTLE